MRRRRSAATSSRCWRRPRGRWRPAAGRPSRAERQRSRRTAASRRRCRRPASRPAAGPRACPRTRTAGVRGPPAPGDEDPVLVDQVVAPELSAAPGRLGTCRRPARPARPAALADASLALRRWARGPSRCARRRTWADPVSTAISLLTVVRRRSARPWPGCDERAVGSSAWWLLVVPACQLDVGVILAVPSRTGHPARRRAAPNLRSRPASDRAACTYTYAGRYSPSAADISARSWSSSSSPRPRAAISPASSCTGTTVSR